MHEKVLQSENAQSPQQRESLSLHALLEMAELVSSLYFCNVCVSLCNRSYVNMYIYTYIKQIYGCTAAIVISCIAVILDRTTSLGL